MKQGRLMYPSIAGSGQPRTIALRSLLRLLVMIATAIGPCAAWSAEAPAVIHPLEWPAAAAPGSAIDPRTEQFVDQQIGTMSTEEKVGQLIQADIDSIKPEDLRNYKLGSIEAGGNAAPGGAGQSLSIPLSCLASQGADLSHVAAPFALVTGGRFTVSFSEVRLSRRAGRTDCR